MNYKLKYLFTLIISIITLNIACKKEAIQTNTLANTNERYNLLRGSSHGKVGANKKTQQSKQTEVKKENKKSGKETDANKSIAKAKVLTEKKAALDKSENILKSKAAAIGLSRYALARFTAQRNELREILNTRPNDANLLPMAAKAALSTDVHIIQQGISTMMNENLANLEDTIKAGEKELLRQEADYIEATKEYKQELLDYTQTESLSALEE